ncbi:MAG TPA: ATPase, T2SS/T4P/T4SS family [Pirellulaceae bacterium]|nr:ATPase, T2SS/T4P/T4SS family [Pirellulaceae bacterium]
MLRTASWMSSGTLLTAALLVLSAGGQLAAQDAWPAYTAPFQRGPGFYLAFWKIFALLFIVWMWVKSADWVSRDSRELGEAIGLPSRIWNPVMVFSFLIGFLAAVTIPIFFAGGLVALLAYAGPFIAYVAIRNGKVTDDQKVFTPSHLKNWFANLGKRTRKARDAQHAWQMGPQVDISAVGPLQMENQQALIEARQSPAYVSVKYLLADALSQRTERIMLDYTAEGVGVNYLIDGVWHNAAPKVHEKQQLDRQLGDQMLAVLKRVCHLKMEERRARQDGKLKLEFGGTKYDATFSSQGTQTGERAVLQFIPITKHVRSLEELGMRDKLREQLPELIGPGHHGLVIFAAMPGDGLTATWQAALRSTDRLMRDFIAVEDIHKREPDVENVDCSKYDSAKGETPEGVIPKLFLKLPEVICIPEIASTEALKLLLKYIVTEDRLGIISLKAKDAADALLRVLALKVPANEVAPILKGVVYTRLVRRLCETCREAYQPEPALLQKLGIPQGRVQVLYREKQPPQPGQEKKKGEPEICPDCRGIGYKGRIALYEFLVVDDKVKEALVKDPKAETIKKLARAAGNRSLQDEGILLVALGTTSITELQRALKQ